MKFNCFTLLLLVFSLSTSAQNAELRVIPFLSDTLAEVIITAQRSELPRFYTPAAVEKLTQKKLLDRQERSTPEALMAVPGVFVQKTNHGGGSPFLRGLTGNQTLLLVDGIRLSNATFRYGPNQYLNTIDPFSIQNIEVLKGSGSVGYGSDALGGTVNVLTQTPDFTSPAPPQGGYSVGESPSQGGYSVGESPSQGGYSAGESPLRREYPPRGGAGGVSGKTHILWRSQNMEKTAHGELAFSGKNIALRVAGSLRKFGDLVGGDTSGVQHPSGYDEAAFDGKGKIRLGEMSVLTLAHQSFRQTDVPVFHKIQLENFARNHTTRQQRQLSYARFEWVPKGASGLQKISATASLQQTQERRDSQKNGSTTLRKEADEVRSLGASVQADYTFAGWWRSMMGAETYHDLVASHRVDVDTVTYLEEAKRGLYPDDATHASAAVFWLNNWKSGNWDFSGGFRYNHFSIKTSDETIGETHLTPGALVWNAAVLRHLSDHDNVFLDFNTAFRAPNVDDLGSLGIVDFRYEVPTADLKPEKSRNFELGWRHKQERWQAEAFVFRNELRDLIARVRVGTDSIAGYPVYRKENVQKGFVQGIETSGNILIINGLQLEGALAWQYGQNVTDDEPLRRIPPLFGRAGLHFSQINWQVTLESLFASKQKRLAAGDKSDNRIPAGGTPGWQVVNLYGSWSWKWLKLRAGFWNMLNRDYRYHGSGVNGMGRSVSVGIEARF